MQVYQFHQEFMLIEPPSLSMDWPNITRIAIGLLGIALTYVLASPGERVIGFGPLRFDPVIAAIGGFGFLDAWGILSVFLTGRINL